MIKQKRQYSVAAKNGVTNFDATYFDATYFDATNFNATNFNATNFDVDASLINPQVKLNIRLFAIKKTLYAIAI